MHWGYIRKVYRYAAWAQLGWDYNNKAVNPLLGHRVTTGLTHEFMMLNPIRTNKKDVSVLACAEMSQYGLHGQTRLVVHSGRISSNAA